MKKLMLLFVAFIFLKSVSQEIYISDKLEKIWETSKELKTPESVLYDRQNKILYVSNINGKPLDKNNNGFISKLSTDGKITQLKWVDKLNAPKGMGILNNSLFVTDIDEVVEINLKTGKINKKYKVEGAKFLNDITVAPSGEIFISDMGNQAIHSIKNGELTLWLRADELANVNGLWAERNALLAGVPDRVVSIDFVEKKISDFITKTGDIDGLVSTGKEYIISDWHGTVHLVAPGKEKEKLLDTKAAGINAADIEFDIDQKRLYVPTFSDDRVVCYRLK
jgi:DNA-binding beta-propeller fold protein YncE